jgi:GH35 family endo-1,4-beta-xylanase
MTPPVPQPASPAERERLALDEMLAFGSDAWREVLRTARDGIETYRKRDVVLRLTDRRDQPLARRTVRVVQTGTDFLWGYCGWGLLNALRDGSIVREDVTRTNERLAALFNSVNLMLYWVEKHCARAPSSEERLGHPDYSNLQQGVDWALARGLTPKGHPLFWPVPKAIPNWLGRYDYATKLTFLEVRIRSLASRFRNRIRVYDAVNEMLWEAPFAKTAERHWPHLAPIAEIADYIEPILRWARDEDPDACYLLNDYNILLGDRTAAHVAAKDGSWVTFDAQTRRYRQLIEELGARGTPPGAVGIQTFNSRWANLDLHGATYDYLGAETGLPVHITEFRPDADRLKRAGLPDSEIQDRLSDFVESVLVCAFGHPAVEAFYFWGDQDWLFDPAGAPTRFHDRLSDLLHRQWRTDTTLETDGDGCARFRGFCGTYSLRLSDRGSARVYGFPFHVPQTSRGEMVLTLSASA